MNAATLTPVAYDSRMRPALVSAWNAIYADYWNFTPLTESVWQARVEEAAGGSAFDPNLLRVALGDDEVIGFAHGGVWEGEFLDCLIPHLKLPGMKRKAVGYLALIAVRPEARHQGVGQRLLASLRDTLRAEQGDLPLLADGRAYNPFYGNFFAPVAPLWGTTEGMAVREEDSETRRFLDAAGFQHEVTGLTLCCDLGASQSRWTRTHQAVGVEPPAIEIALESSYQAILGSTGGATFPYPNRSLSWVALVEDRQVGSLIAYPFDDAHSQRWGIFTFEVEKNLRGRGVGRAILTRVLSDLLERGVTEVETFAIPRDSSAAILLYESLGFEKRQAWLIYG